ncbi:MAG: glycosyltransferase family 4 protein [Chitinophagaceae bacterium]
MSRSSVALLFFDRFFPAYKAGGPARSSVAMIEHLQPFCRMRVFTSAFDLNETAMLPGIRADEWNPVKQIEVYYSSNNRFVRNLIRTVNKLDFHIYHFNSFFSPRFTIIPLLLIKVGILPKQKIIISPRGECSSAALEIKSFKKKLYLFVFRHFLKTGIKFHATTPREKQDIRNILKVSAQSIFQAANLRSSKDFPSGFSPSLKRAGFLRMIFVSRISPIKNIEFCLRVLSNLNSRIDFDCYGIAEDAGYLSDIKDLAKMLPENIHFRYLGPIAADKVVDTIKLYDLLFFPSKSENFGHVILESFMASRPVLISNNTYWQNLSEMHAGWDFPLDTQVRFEEVVRHLSTLDSQEFEKYSKGAYQRALLYFNDTGIVNSYLEAYDLQSGSSDERSDQ